MESSELSEALDELNQRIAAIERLWRSWAWTMVVAQVGELEWSGGRIRLIEGGQPLLEAEVKVRIRTAASVVGLRKQIEVEQSRLAKEVQIGADALATLLEPS